MTGAAPRREAALLAALLVAFLAVNLATATRYPAVWVDEIQFADPAVNHVLGHGFTSSVWVKQTAGELWAGNAPLYPLLLTSWLSLLGVSALAVRSLNYVLVALAALLLVVFLRRTRVVPSERGRLLVAALFLLGHGVMFCYRMGRYDVLGMVWAVLAALVWAGPGGAGGLVRLALIGLLLPATGLQLVPASVLLAGVLVVFQGRAALSRAAALLGGVAAGGLALRAGLGALGVWEAFRASTSAVGVIGKGVLGKVRELPRIYAADKSFVLVLLCALLLGLLSRGELVRRFRTSPLAFGLVVAAVVPPALQVAAKFPIYYVWMAYLPLLVGVVATLETAPPPAWGRLAVGAALALAAAVGLPARLAVVSTLWAERDPARLEAAVASRIGPSDVVVTDFKAYYVVKRTARALYGLPYLGLLTPPEKEAVTVLLVREEAVPAVVGAVGGVWAPSGGPIAAGSVSPEPRAFRFLRDLRDENYPLRLLRRVP